MREERQGKKDTGKELGQIISKLKIENEELKLRVSQLENKENIHSHNSSSKLFELDLNLDFNRFKNNFEYKSVNLNNWVERLNSFFLSKIENLEGKCTDISRSYAKLSHSRSLELEDSNRKIVNLAEEIRKNRQELAQKDEELRMLRQVLANKEEDDVERKIKEGFGSFRDSKFVSDRNQGNGQKADTDQQRTAMKTEAKRDSNSGNL